MNAVVLPPPVLASLDDLPPVERCLSDAEIRLTESARREMALLAQGPNAAILVYADPPSATTAGQLRELRSRARQKGYAIRQEYRATPAVVAAIHQRFALGPAEAAARTEAATSFDALVFRAAEVGASDIHIVLHPAADPPFEVKFRVHGELEPVALDAGWTHDRVRGLCSCAYNVLAGIRDVTWDPSRKQDANITREIGGRTYRLRYAHGPLYPEGVHVVLRLLSTGRGFAFAPTLQHLGYSDGQAELIGAMAEEPSGIVVISGETGSGKSTTLANLMHMLLARAGGGLAVLTVEDPPEYEVPGILQSPVVHSRDDRGQGRSPYAEAIRSAMRRDPDLLMIGEIRDLDTALLAAQSAQSGHPVLTTIHASRALDIVGRLEGMGASLANNPMNRLLLCAPRFLTGLIHQVLVPVLCGHCAIPWHAALDRGRVEPGLAARVAAVLDDPGAVRVRGQGCDRCRQGVRGRSVCAEVVAPDARLRQLLRDRKDQEAFDYWAGEAGGYPIWAHALDKLREGLVAPADVEACLGRLRREGPGGAANAKKSMASSGQGAPCAE